MLKNKAAYLFLTVIISVIASISVCRYYRSGDKSIVVVDAIRLFNEFQMKIELEKEEEGRLKFLGAQADSIANMLRMMESKGIRDPSVAQAYEMAKMTLQSEYERSNREINVEVWKRLNPLIDAFGKMKKYSIIIGANGMGSVLYNESSDDVTKEAIDYANKHYNEGR